MVEVIIYMVKRDLGDSRVYDSRKLRYWIGIWMRMGVMRYWIGIWVGVGCMNASTVCVLVSCPTLYPCSIILVGKVYTVYSNFSHSALNLTIL